MKKIFWSLGLIIILGLSSCSTSTTKVLSIPAYEYPKLEAKKYVIIAPIIIKANTGESYAERRHTNLTFINGRLMEEVIKLGGHDVINVRYDSTSDGRIIAVTAIVIKYIE